MPADGENRQWTNTVNRRFFTLLPFDRDAENAPDIQITGRISRGLETLAIKYQVAGKCADLDLPEVTGVPERRDFLWKATCFELFIKEMDSDVDVKRYLEINLSPAGHWNIYRFDEYRTGMREELRMAAPAIHVENKNPEVWEISAELNLDGIITASQPILASVSAVVKTVAGHLSYWALTHPGVEPDFHHKGGFVIRLE